MRLNTVTQMILTVLSRWLHGNTFGRSIRLPPLDVLLLGRSSMVRASTGVCALMTSIDHLLPVKLTAFFLQGNPVFHVLLDSGLASRKRLFCLFRDLIFQILQFFFFPCRRQISKIPRRCGIGQLLYWCLWTAHHSVHPLCRTPWVHSFRDHNPSYHPGICNRVPILRRHSRWRYTSTH